MVEQRKEDLRNCTISLLLEIRKAYLATGQSALTHWEQIQTRSKRAARQATSVEEWFEKISKGLRLNAAGSKLAYELQSLKNLVGQDIDQWLNLVEQENSALIAETRAISDARRAAKLNEEEESEQDFYELVNKADTRKTKLF